MGEFVQATRERLLVALGLEMPKKRPGEYTQEQASKIRTRIVNVLTILFGEYRNEWLYNVIVHSRAFASLRRRFASGHFVNTRFVLQQVVHRIASEIEKQTIIPMLYFMKASEMSIRNLRLLRNLMYVRVGKLRLALLAPVQKMLRYLDRRSKEDVICSLTDQIKK